jgi:3-oxoacyl-[acyl-carrier-protein] synthase II
MEALDTAAFWIRSGIVEECLLIAAEECDWLSAEALTYYHPKLIASEGAGALLLSASGSGPRCARSSARWLHLLARTRALLPELAAQTRRNSRASHTHRRPHRHLQTRPCGAGRVVWEPLAGRAQPETRPGREHGRERRPCSSCSELSTARETQQPVVISMPGVNTAAYACVFTP